jgi:hypothetical protein
MLIFFPQKAMLFRMQTQLLTYLVSMAMPLIDKACIAIPTQNKNIDITNEI